MLGLSFLLQFQQDSTIDHKAHGISFLESAAGRADSGRLPLSIALKTILSGISGNGTFPV